jgi:predicted ester cyclase
MKESDRKLGHRWFELVWNQGKREAITEMVGPHTVFHDSGIDTVGSDNFSAFYDRLKGMFSEFHIHVDDSFAENNMLCVRWTCSAKHNGPAFGIDATGTPIRVTGISIARVADGQFKEVWQNWDMLGMMQQIQGAASAPTYVTEEAKLKESGMMAAAGS